MTPPDGMLNENVLVQGFSAFLRAWFTVTLPYLLAYCRIIKEINALKLHGNLLNASKLPFNNDGKSKVRNTNSHKYYPVKAKSLYSITITTIKQHTFINIP
jgi:hypothetical protein